MFNLKFTVAEFIKIATLTEKAVFFFLTFKSNVAKALIYAKEIFEILGVGLNFTDNNILTTNLPADGICMNIRSSISVTIANSHFENSMSSSTSAALKFVDDTDYDKFLQKKKALDANAIEKVF